MEKNGKKKSDEVEAFRKIIIFAWSICLPQSIFAIWKLLWVCFVLFIIYVQRLNSVYTLARFFFCAMHKCVYAAQEAKHQEHWMSANRMQHSQNPLLLPIIATIITLQVLQCAHVSTRFSTIFCHFFISLVLELLSFYKRHIPTVSMQKWIWINPKSL